MLHEQLWAPWRLAYILEPKPERTAGCFLCQFVSQPAAADRDNFVLWRGTSTVVLLNRYPYNNGHLLVAPSAHKAQLTDLTPQELQESARVLQWMTGIVQHLMSPHGFNLGVNLGEAAGAGVPGHLHWHIVPRWRGDTNFMSVLADVNVIPQSLQALYEILQAKVHEDPGPPA